VKSPLLVLTAIYNPETRSLVKLVLEGAGHRVTELDGYSQANSLLSSRLDLDQDIVVVESPPTGSSEAAQFRKFLKRAHKHSLCLILGAEEQLLRERASGLGIKHFLTKPVTCGDLESLVDELRGPVVRGQCGDLVFPTSLPAVGIPADMNAAIHLEELGDNQFFLAASSKMLKIYRHVKLLANVDVNVLILGESGTGKEVLARLIHKHSRRSQNRFLTINCAALPVDLLESELFGHERGAFTGAIKDKPGRFEEANGGTLLLDEIGEIGAHLQAKFLRVLQDGEFTRLGGLKSTKVNVRVLAATNIQMESALLDKTFREDLYYRLSTFVINLPPLRERREEIPYLIEETIRRTPAEMKNGRECKFSSQLTEAVLLYDWPGNVRELCNFVTRVIIMQDADAAIAELEAKTAAISKRSIRTVQTARHLTVQA